MIWVMTMMVWNRLILEELLEMTIRSFQIGLSWEAWGWTLDMDTT